MSQYIEKIRAYLAQKPEVLETNGVSSMMEYLQLIYTENNPIDNDKIRTSFEALDGVFIGLPLERINRLFSVTVDLCLEYEREAFLTGLQVGAKLSMELFGG